MNDVERIQRIKTHICSICGCRLQDARSNVCDECLAKKMNELMKSKSYPPVTKYKQC